MAYVSETGMLCASSSTRLQSTFVEQTYTELELPSSHLSLLPRFSISLSEMSTKACDVPRLISCSTPASTSCSPTTSPSHKLGFTKYSAMSSNCEPFLAAPQPRPQKWYGQRVLVLPRSASAVDLQAQPRPHLHYGSRLRPSGPSVGNIRSYVNAAENEETFENSAAVGRLESAQHDFQRSSEISQDEKRTRRKLHYQSYQELHILSMYQDNSSGSSSKVMDYSPACVESSEQDEASSSSYSDSDTTDSGNSSPFPRTPDEAEFAEHGQDPRLDFQTSRSLQRSQARQVHVIEHRRNKSYMRDVDKTEGISMQATVLTVPGKPRLIQIHRPQHTDHSCSEGASRIDSTSSPSTPEQQTRRVTTTSSYNTPTSGTPFSDVSRTASEATPTPKMAPRLSICTDVNAAAYRPSATCVNTPYQAAIVHPALRQLADPFGSPASIDSSTTIGTLFAQDSPPNPVNSSVEGPTSEKSSLHGLYLEEIYESRIRESITFTMKAFDALAASNFTVQSVEFSYFRTQYLNASMDETLAISLRNIFPHASSFSRSTLAAWLVVDLHFKQLFTELPPKPPPYDIELALSEHRVPAYEKASFLRETPAASRLWDHRESTQDIEASLRSLGPEYIPSKARSVLGIQTDPIRCKANTLRHAARRSRDNLENQARSVHEGVQTLGQKLVRDLLSAPSTPEISPRQRSMKVLPIRSRGSTDRQNSSSPTKDFLEDSARGLWEACRCITAMA